MTIQLKIAKHVILLQLRFILTPISPCCHQIPHEAWGLGCNLEPCWHPRAVLPSQSSWSEWPGLLFENMETYGPELQPRALSGSGVWGTSAGFRHVWCFLFFFISYFPTCFVLFSWVEGCSRDGADLWENQEVKRVGVQGKGPKIQQRRLRKWLKQFWQTVNKYTAEN